MNKIISSIISLLFLIGVNSVSAEETIKVGSVAPDFTLVDQKNQPQTLSKMKGRWLVLYFYPKDETPGCVAEACSFRDNMVAIRAKNTVVWGVSVDNKESHADFSKHHQLPFTLLADPDGKVAQRYGSIRDLLIFKIAKRHSFIIDPKGNIAKIYRNVTPKSHVEEVLNDLQKLQGS
ncbi:MAG TPA: peroxiredoxin [Leucothrix mucor]|uniref:thioredoxin-dependent peroxiredoxin n=1 Tax=Leucothrix mucor TaxID=45248 RepID=A0A7V2T220_LEUMU|nr:peroxiredoxin [Leucothrix mucor]